MDGRFALFDAGNLWFRNETRIGIVRHASLSQHTRSHAPNKFEHVTAAPQKAPEDRRSARQRTPT